MRIKWLSLFSHTKREDRVMNNFDPTQMFAAFQPQQAFANVASYTRSMLSEMEKQAERWTEYGLSQAAEGQKLFRSMQAQAFGVTKSIVDATEKAFQKTGA
jgi:hypothetical protein